MEKIKNILGAIKTKLSKIKMKRLKKVLNTIKLKWLKETSLTILLIVIIVAVFVGLNLGIEALELRRY